MLEGVPFSVWGEISSWTEKKKGKFSQGGGFGKASPVLPPKSRYHRKKTEDALCRKKGKHHFFLKRKRKKLDKMKKGRFAGAARGPF